MDLNDLPPIKRLRLIQQQQQNSSSSSSSPSPCSPLPTKKRKESRNSTFLHSPPPSPPKPTVYSLPAKKRVCALHPHYQNDAVSPFDLNEPPTPEKPQQQQQEENATATENDDDGIVCCVCQSTDGDPADPIVLCDGCDLMVHASCYGNPLCNGVPEGDWFCERCRFGIGADVACSLCPEKKGAMKRTTEEGAWAHLVCALFVPEVFFSDPEGREEIDCSKVPKKSWSQKCYVCECCDGCALVCSEPKCGLAFHVTCALKEDLFIEYKEGKKGATIVAGFCKTHTELWEKQQLSGKYKIVAVEDKKQQK